MKIEYTEKEFIALIGLGTRMFDCVDNFVDKQSLLALKRMRRTIKNAILDFDENSEEESESESDPLNFTVFDGGKNPSQPLVMNEYASKGKDLFYGLIELWMINFCVEGSEQPPRAERCEELTQSYDGRAIIHYMEYLRQKYPNGGLTYAIRDTGLVSNDQVRLVAENLTAVASACRYTQLASYLEHPNPSSQEDFFND